MCITLCGGYMKGGNGAPRCVAQIKKKKRCITLYGRDMDVQEDSVIGLIVAILREFMAGFAYRAAAATLQKQRDDCPKRHNQWLRSAHVDLESKMNRHGHTISPAFAHTRKPTGLRQRPYRTTQFWNN